MKVLDLFAGIGGFSLAAHWMGWETVAFVEWAEFQQKVLAKNFPGVPIYGDIRKFDGSKYAGSVDIICGGFPCQPFSHAGKRKGKSDDRFLFPEMLRVISEVRPRWVIAENVRGILSIESGDVFEEVCSQLEGIGYEVQTFCVPASAVDAPHRRDRVWFMGRRTGNDTARNTTNCGTGSLGTIPARESSLAGRSLVELAGASFNTDSIGERTGLGEVQSEDGEIPERHDDAESSNADFCVATDTTTRRIQRTQSENTGIRRTAQKERHKQTNYVAGLDSDAPDADTNGKNISRKGREVHHINRDGSAKERERIELESRSFGNNWGIGWLEAATALCRVDDGLPRQLDRTNRLKALGNSIVPQIAYEIFKAIEQAEIQFR
jgi:DNA (cytosine-5)-methyltransferase 1